MIKRRGFTLVELVMSVAITTVLLGGIMSSILLASHAVPNGENASRQAVRSGDIVARIAHELYTAQSFSERLDNAVEFTVPDRDGDASPEIIRYAWSGTEGDPLTRQYNGGTAVNVAEHSYEFQLNYDVFLVNTEESPTRNESAEKVLISFEAAAGTSNFAVDEDKWVGQCFQPTLLVGTISWSVKRVKFRAKLHGPTDGETRVQLRPGDAGVPGSTILEEVPMYESTLTDTYAWREFPFSSVSELSTSDELCLVLQHVSSTHSCDVQYQGSGAFPTHSSLVQTDDGGASWTKQIGRSMVFYVYGTETSEGQPDITNIYSLTGVRITLRISETPASRVQTGVHIINAPEVTGP